MDTDMDTDMDMVIEIGMVIEIDMSTDNGMDIDLGKGLGTDMHMHMQHVHGRWQRGGPEDQSCSKIQRDWSQNWPNLPLVGPVVAPEAKEQKCTKDIIEIKPKEFWSDKMT